MPEEIKNNPLYKMIDEGDKHFMMEDHKGQQFAVAKDHLDEEMHDTVRKLGIQPNASDYTQPPAPDVSGDLSKAASSVGNFLHSFDKGPESNPASVQNTPGLAPFMSPQFKPGVQAATTPAPELLEAPPQPTAIPPEGQVLAPKAVTGSVVNPELQTLNDAYKQLGEGHTQEAQALGKAADQQATAYEQQRVQQEKLNADYQVHRKELEAKGDTIYKDVLDSKINPDHYIQSKSTWGKIGAAISIALGGLAGGLNKTGQNLALDTINKSIQNDIEAQKDDRHNKQTLYAKNLEALHDADMAHQMTSNQLLAITQAKVQEAAAKATNPQMQGRLKQLMSQLKIDQQAKQHELAVKQAIRGVGQPGQEGRINPELLPEKDRERIVQLPNGKQYFAKSSKDRDEIDTKLESLNPILETLGAIDQIGPSALVPKSPEANRAHALRNSLVPLLNEFQKINRLTPEDEKLILSMVNDPTQLFGGTGRSDVLREIISRKMEGTFKNRLTNYQGAYVPKNQVPIGKVKQQVAAISPKPEK